MQVGMTKDQGLYNKPSAAVHPGALAAGTLPQYNTISILSIVVDINIIMIEESSYQSLRINFLMITFIRRQSYWREFQHEGLILLI